MILGENIGSVYSEGREIQRVYSKGMLVWEKEPIDYSIRPFTVKAIDGKVTVRLSPKKHNSIDENPVLDFKYSINGTNWVNTTTKTAISLNKSDIVSIIATDIESCYIAGDKYYVGGEKYRVADISGNIMSLIYGDDFIGQVVWPERGIYYDPNGFFSHCNIRNARNLILPATVLSDKAYYYMFGMCSDLITAPKILPATTLATRCYASMYANCVNLKSVSELPATTLAEECYSSMYGGCGITTAPELPATTLATGCYMGMFASCGNLTTAPELPASDLVYECYEDMFRLSYNLTSIKCYATNSGVYSFADCVDDWLLNNIKEGVLYCKQVDGGKNPLEDYIPSTWTVEYFT